MQELADCQVRRSRAPQLRWPSGRVTFSTLASERPLTFVSVRVVFMVMAWTVMNPASLSFFTSPGGDQGAGRRSHGVTRCKLHRYAHR